MQRGGNGELFLQLSITDDEEPIATDEILLYHLRAYSDRTEFEELPDLHRDVR